MRKLISNLIKLLYKFLVVEDIDNPEIILLRQLKQRKLYKLFLHKYEKAVKLFDNEAIYEENIQFKILLDGTLASYYYETDNRNAGIKQSLKLLESNTLMYVFNLVKAYNAWLVENKKSIGGAINLMLESINFDRFLSSIESFESETKQKIRLLLLLIAFERSQDEKLYREIKQFCFRYSKEVNSTSVFVGYSFLQRYIKKKLAENKPEYYSERHQIYKIVEKNYYATGNNKMNFTDFRNFVLSAVVNRDIGWLNYTMRKYIPVLVQKGNEGLGLYFDSLIHFHEKEYDKALSVLSHFKTDRMMLHDIILTLDSKSLLLCIYYELGYFSEAFYNVDSFYVFIRKNKVIAPEQRQSFGGFIRYYKQLLKAKTDKDYHALNELKRKLTNESVNSKQWLLEKTEELLALK
jgi:hypothetical protein